MKYSKTIINAIKHRFFGTREMFGRFLFFLERELRANRFYELIENRKNFFIS